MRFACASAAIAAACLLAQACSSSTALEPGSSSPTAPTPTTTPSSPTSIGGTVSLTGTVSSKSGSRRLGGVTVTVLDGENAGRSTLTNGEGHYQFDGLHRAHANVAANAARFTAVRGGVYVDGITALNFGLAPALTGIVRSASGDPIRGATISVLDGPNAGRSATTNSEGLYRFEDMQEASSNFSATASGFFEDRRGANVDGTADLDFVLRALAPIAPFTGSWRGGSFRLAPSCPPTQAPGSPDSCRHYFRLDLTQVDDRVTGRFASNSDPLTLTSQPTINVSGIVDGNRLSISGARTFGNVTETIDVFEATLSSSGSSMSGSYRYRLSSIVPPSVSTYFITFSDVRLVIE